VFFDVTNVGRGRIDLPSTVTVCVRIVILISVKALFRWSRIERHSLVEEISLSTMIVSFFNLIPMISLHDSYRHVFFVAWPPFTSSGIASIGLPAYSVLVHMPY